MKITKQIVLALALALLAPNLFAIQGTLVTAKEDLRGDIRWDAEKQLYTVAFKKGKTLVNLQRPADDVVRLEIPEPPELKRALALIEKGSAAAAVPVLNKIANDYLRLKWDMIALRHLVLAHLAADKPDRAYDTCKTVLVRDKSAAYTGAFAPAFWQVLLKLNKRPLLESLIVKAIRGGDRTASAAAHVLRGDLIREAAKDNKNEIRRATKDDKSEIRRALTEGYLRVILLYQDVPEIRREALLKGAECYDKLGRSDLAENFRTLAKGTVPALAAENFRTLAKGTVPALAQGTVPREKQSILGS